MLNIIKIIYNSNENSLENNLNEKNVLKNFGNIPINFYKKNL